MRDGLVLTYTDFGMQVVKQTDEQVWYRGYGPDPYVYYARKGPKAFLGGTFEVESYGDLEKLVFFSVLSLLKMMMLIEVGHCSCRMPARSQN